ncbi:hypothetical protein BC628DRAFT_1348247 [Trametes gibbosa]|nr:hypothetical protein BC628DRAFT_1348247 [Trametes gibbosa]
MHKMSPFPNDPPSYGSLRPLDPGHVVTATKTNGRCRTSVFCMSVIAISFFALFLAQNAALVRCPLNDIPAAERTELRRKWHLERDAHEIEIVKWARERGQYEEESHRWALERETHRREQDDWRKEREEEERHRLEVLRRSQGVYWTEPHGDPHCHSYGTRVYSAYLKDIPEYLNFREVCDSMPPVRIHNRDISKPTKCERNNNGEVVGVWYVDFDEPNCRPYWASMSNEGCTPGKTGFQKFTARLDGIGSGDHWETMCASTPAVIQGLHFDHPSSCENKGLWSGMVGMWEIPNLKCP